MLIDGLKSYTLKLHLNRLRTLFKYAFDNELISKIPKLNIEIPKEIPKEIKILNDDDIEIILSDFKHSRYYIPICIAIYSGMRIGEIMGLCWDDIDFINNTININKQWKEISKGVHGFGNLKSTNSYRTIPLNIKLKSILKPLKSNGRILYSFSSTKAITLNSLKSLKPYGISMHSFRHYFCTKLISNGIDFKTTSYIMGHNVNMTMQIYSHYNKDIHKKVNSIINDIF